MEPEPLYRLLEEAVIKAEDGPKMWRVTWRNIETGNKFGRILTQDEFEASLAQNRPADKPLWTRDEIDEIGTRYHPMTEEVPLRSILAGLFAVSGRVVGEKMLEAATSAASRRVPLAVPSPVHSSGKRARTESCRVP